MPDKNTNIPMLGLFIFVSSFVFLSLPVLFHAVDPYDDEPGWAAEGQLLFSAFFLRHDFSSSLWHEVHNNYGSVNPRIGVYFLGLYDFLSAKIFNIVHHVFPFVVMLRLFAVGMSALTVFMFFRLVALTESLGTASLAVILLLINPIFRGTSIVLLATMPCFFFIFCSLIAYVKIDQAFNRNFFPAKWLGLAGILTGMAIGSKMYGLALLPVFLAVLVANIRKMSLPKLLIGFLLFFSAAFFIFIISNPLLYSHLIEGIKAMTVGHLANHGMTPMEFSRNAPYKYVVFYPFVLFRMLPFYYNSRIFFTPFQPFNVETSCLVGYLLFLACLLKIKIRPDYQKLVFLASSFAMSSFLVGSIWPVLSVTSASAVPMFAVVWFIASTVTRFFPKRIKLPSFIKDRARSSKPFLALGSCFVILLFVALLSQVTFARKHLFTFDEYSAPSLQNESIQTKIVRPIVVFVNKYLIPLDIEGNPKA